MQEFVKKHKVTYPIIKVSQATLAAYGIDGFPTKYVVDASGKVALVDPPELNAAALEPLLAAAKPGKAESGPPELGCSKKFDAALKALRAGDYKAAAPDLAKLEKE